MEPGRYFIMMNSGDLLPLVISSNHTAHVPWNRLEPGQPGG